MNPMKKWFHNWLDEYGDFLGFVFFCLVVAALLKGCDMLA